MTIGERIRNAREKKRMSQEELATKIGVKHALISKYETGIIKNIPVTKLTDIAKALDVDLSVLLGWDDKEIPESPEALQLLKMFEEKLINNGTSSEQPMSKEYLNRIINSYYELNLEGKKTAAERVEELTHIEKYKYTEKQKIIKKNLDKLRKLIEDDDKKSSSK